jgi:hypothetical protein
MAAISTGGPHGQSIPGQLEGVHVVSSFGVDNTTLGRPGCDVLGFIGSERVLMLARRESYFKCTHHDHKVFDFDGRMIPPGPPITQPLLGGGEQFSTFVPLRARRPAATYRLARVIVNSFTAMLFGRGRWPTLKVAGDPKTEDFVAALTKAMNLRTVMIRARAIGGSVGSVGLSWRFYKGKPYVGVHSGKRILVHSWSDEGELVPEHVSEIYTFSKQVWDSQKKANVTKWFWHRRDWTPIADVAFFPCEFKKDQDPVFEIDEKNSYHHGHGQCHFIWIRNLPDDDDLGSIDGQPDYAEQYESLESIDILKSVIVRGATLNLDPTVVLKIDLQTVAAMGGVKKGSDNALNVGLTGDARYMELSGTSIAAGTELFSKLRDAILEAAQCVIPDPNQVAGAGTSAVALKVVYEPMLAKADILREQYGQAIERLIEQVISFVQECMQPRLEQVTSREVDVANDIDLEVTREVEIKPVLSLPPKVVAVTEIGEDGKEHESFGLERREPGIGGDVELDWGAYFSPTPDDKMKETQTLQLAVSVKILSRRTATEELAHVYKRDAHEEWKRLQDEADEEQAGVDAMYPPIGGEVDSLDELPPDAEPTTIGGIEIPPSEMISVIRVDELRTSRGLSPLGGADGKLTIAQFKAKGKAAGEVLGAASGQSEAAKDPTIIETVASPEKPRGDAVSSAASGQQLVTPTETAKIVLVDEARVLKGLPRFGPEKGGDLTVAEFEARVQAEGAASGAVVGQAEGQLEVEQELSTRVDSGPE